MIRYKTALLLFLLLLCPIKVHADASPGDYFISLGADLSKRERAAVFKNLEISEEDTLFSKVIKVTNEEEHQYLDNYVNEKVIGKRALSSVYIEKAEEGSGIQIELSHITYCTPSMYRSALATAGLSDVKVKITGPYDISGTAALVGTMKAYEVMTGKEISEETKDAVNDELITTKKLSEEFGEDKAKDIIMDLKEKAGQKGDLNSTDLNDLIEKVCDKHDVNLSEEDMEEIKRLTKRFDSLDIDINSVLSQAKDIYNGIKEDIKEQGVGDKIISFFKRIFHNFIGSLERRSIKL